MATTALLDRIFEPFGEVMTPETAARFVEMRASEDVQRRLDELAEKCTAGELTHDEREEHDTLIQAIEFISIMQSKARQVLKRHGS